ncbi:D-amino acid dehydrogenase [Undibacterium sp. Ji49W]|uniref:D-amino acid dehydrogenase n=1 Tax=Undibacterium sp. Ji49W TaxID=3413040 RepID=UPI003BEFC438
MRICIIGAGVIGLTSAHALARRGHEIIVIDAHEQAGQGASKANGAQLSYSYVAPLADATVWKSLPAYLLDPQSPLRWQPQWDIRQWQWIVRFLRACTTHRSRQSSIELLRLAFFSRDCLTQLQNELALDFDLRTAGKLVMLSSAKAVDVASRQLDFQRRYGCVQEMLSPVDCLKVEPSLALSGRDWFGGVYTPSEQVGDCGVFCTQLSKHLAQADNQVEFAFNTCITSATVADGKIMALQSTAGDIVADAYVLANGVGSVTTAASMGIELPIYPLKGYSLTYEASDDKQLPSVSVTDLSKKIVYARIGKYLRVAGKVEMTGNDLSLKRHRWASIATEAQQLFPALRQQQDDMSPWTGLRPATPTGIPIIGRSKIKNLYLNTGHGALGWTLACGSAEKLASELCNEPIPSALQTSQTH